MKSILKPPYESSKVSYKHSGIEWLGEIPQHWEIVKFKYIFKERSIKGFGHEQQLASTQNYGVIPKSLYPTRTVEALTSDLNFFKLVRKNNFVISLRSFEGGIEYSQYQGIISPAYTILESTNNIEHSYFQFLFKSSIFISALQIYKTGIREGQNISYLELQQDFLPLPPLQEQKAIAEFLDKKCDKISQFIESKQKLITLLQEKKQALINECVTKGLNCYTKHNVESRPLRGAQKEKDSRQYKNSGVEYLGTIPKHWEVRRLASFGKFSKGGNIWRNDLLDEGISTLIYGDIYTKYEIKTHTLHSKVSQETAKNATPIYKGDILFSGSGETKEDIGKNIVYLGDEKAFAGGDVIIFRQNQNDALFLSYALNTQGVRFCKLIESKGEIIVHIYASNLRDIKIPLPPLQEQKAIASYLDTQITKIDLAIEKTKQQITYIKEYKTSLINQAVCGRIQLKDEQCEIIKKKT